MPKDIDGIAAKTVSRVGVPQDELAREVASLGARWSIANGELVLQLRGVAMAKCGAAIAHATKLADEMDHHPKIVVDHGGTMLTIHTHERAASSKGDNHAITMIDLVYAARLEKWLRDNGW